MIILLSKGVKKDMEYKKLDLNNVEVYITYLKLAMSQEPEMMLTDSVDEDAIRKRLPKK
jgi:hypothetical protein